MDTTEILKYALERIAETDHPVEASSLQDWKRRVQMIAKLALEKCDNKKANIT